MNPELNEYIFRMSLCVDFQEIENYPKEDEYYHQRMKTYEDCSDEDISNPEKWARAGFVWNSILKILRCKYCFTMIHHVNCDDFKHEDHCAIKEHVKRNPTCKFVAPFLQKPGHPEMKNEEDRIKSFKKPCGGWIIENEWLKKELVDMGAFCKQNNELEEHQLICYQCDLSLGWITNEELSIGLEPEDRTAFIRMTLFEHAEESPTCAHMIKFKGIEYIEEALEFDPWENASEYTIDYEDSEEETTDSNHENIMIKLTEIKEHIDNRYLNMPDACENEKDRTISVFQEERYRCKICLVNESNVLFLPCRHFASCTNCNKKIKNECHMCRQRVDKKINIYM